MLFHAIVLCFFTLFQVYTTTAQFPDHTDFEKLGEVQFRNDIYKILRPSLHKVTDHFKDVMMKTDTQSANEKTLMDNNGFRHHWSTLTQRDSLPKAANDIQETIDGDSFEIIKGLSHSKKFEENEPLKRAKDKVILDAIMEQWKLDKDKVLKKQPELNFPEKKLYPVETIMLCPYFGLIRAKHFVQDENENSILKK
ncbi:hypothetical protein NE865_11061 [Phthorimaea operculella]|nr:hypothetical protein NE865_11061 [Phthorimaea operculella]